MADELKIKSPVYKTPKEKVAKVRADIDIWRKALENQQLLPKKETK